MNFFPTLLAQTVQTTDPVATDGRGWLTSVVIWLFVGLVAGFAASKIVNKTGEGVVLDIILGLVGSVVGGFIIHLFGFHRDGSIVLSILVAILGAVLVLVVYHKLIRQGRRM